MMNLGTAVSDPFGHIKLPNAVINKCLDIWFRLLSYLFIYLFLTGHGGDAIKCNSNPLTRKKCNC